MIKFNRWNGLGIAASLLAASACAHNEAKPNQIAATGPTVLYAQSRPGTIELNRDLQPIEPAEIVADVKDFRSPVTSVMLQFNNVPVTVPMQNIGGTTWRAELSPRQLEMMAVSGKTIRYDAQVVAQDANGDTGMSQRPVQVAIRTPDLSAATAG